MLSPWLAPFWSGATSLVLLSLCNDAMGRPFYMRWSDKTYGPDGPWNAVTIGVGNPGQEIDLYPGSTWESRVFLPSICSNKSISSTCYARDAGIFHPEFSSTFENESISLGPNGEWGPGQFGAADAVGTTVEADRALIEVDLAGTLIPDVDFITISQGYQTYPGGGNYPLQVGILALGAPDINQTFSRGSSDPLNGTFIASYLWKYADVGISSYSWGMHIGSAAHKIEGSLILGGYDKNRVIGNVSAQPYSGPHFPIELLDIELGVADGESPWDGPGKSRLLAQGNSSLSSGITVKASPADPYLYLPESTCDALASELPVTYQPDYGLYFWDESDPRYLRIVTSPSYLDFTFNKDGVNTEKISIKVPFALLNLTLDAPLVEESVRYFPCMRTTGTYALGRAFLQAAFMGVNYIDQDNGNWFLAQAPGPGYSVTPRTTTITDTDSTIAGSNNGWAESWADYWTPLSGSVDKPQDSNGDSDVKSDGKSDDSSDGLSTGAKAGIGIGCGVAGLLIIGLMVWAVSRRQGRKANIPVEAKSINLPHPYRQVVPAQLSAHTPIYELASSQKEGPYEI
ncbi:hypothetical protein BDW42DRAFT_52088 [Aspergillus taichungensis]|uniref:Peptidase A1 domain-containing protein n=1 Tax=Aspergillus taichungensis TaxID=482145 RepID=A0A2J5HDA7_9EURO|nr:hypothetical protein BDW42DRAFT_52088 [Aspergillus taichungensis]